MSVPLPADGSPMRVEGSPSIRVRSCSAPSSETAAERLTDDILLEILPRVPAKSLCRCRCVSKHWRSLIDHPDLRKKLPPTLAGFFYSTTSTETVQQPPVLLARVPGSLCPLISTSLAFLPSHQRLDLLDCCNGLLLSRWYGVSAQTDEFPYVVCNPATERWVALPASDHRYTVATARLGFDPARSSHFHVFELLYDACFSATRAAGVAVYSSRTGGWVHHKFKQRCFNISRCYSEETVFVNSRLHFHVHGQDDSFEPTEGLAAVDTEAGTCTNFDVPGKCMLDSFLQWSQGRMHYAMFCKIEGDIRLAVYVLDNYQGNEWTLKHHAKYFYITGELESADDWDFQWVGIHPQRDLIFFTRGQGQDTTLRCYEMDFEQVKVICNLKDAKPPYLPYVPLYAELQSLHM